jgi:negative regulator of sigma E activity
MDPTTEQPETLPPAIANRLRRLDRAEPIFDPRTDRAVLEAARSYFAPRPAAARTRRPRWAVPLGAAAAVLLAAVLVRPIVFHAPSADDVDGSGRVDVLDVLALARMRAAGGDASGITEARIDELAYRIVALDSRRAP